MNIRPKRVLRWVIFLAVLPVGLLSGSVLWIKLVESRRWEEMRSQVAEFPRLAPKQDCSRPVLRGEPEPGNAWDDYETAIQSITPRDILNAWRFLEHSPTAKRSDLVELVRSYKETLHSLRRGASKNTGPRPVSGESGKPGLPPELWLTTLAACQAQLLQEEGNLREAGEFLLDAVLFGEDLAGSGPEQIMLGIAVMLYPLNGLKEVIEAASSSRDDLTEMDRELELLDLMFPDVGDAHLAEAMEAGRAFVDAQHVDNYLAKVHLDGKRQLPTWRYGFSERLMMADAFQRHLSVSRVLGEATKKPWAEELEVRSWADRELGNCGNPIVQTVHEIQLKSRSSAPGSESRERRTQLRLLRTAAHFRATGEILRLDDPFGAGKLLHSKSGNHLKVWSVGSEGKDHGGIGGWFQDKGKDIVLEVER